MAIITQTSSRESERLRRSAAASEQGPTAEELSPIFPRTNSLFREINDPQDPTNVSFPFLRRMRKDHMVAMGLHFIALPILKAPYYFDADTAQAQAFADNLIRPIYGRLALTVLRILWAGYSPAAKNFETIQPSWTYFEDGIEKKVWTTPNVDAQVFKPVTPLKPENALPVWKSGSFNGITYDPSYGGVGMFTIGGKPKTDIDLLHSVWAVHDREGEDGSPFGFPRIAYCAPIFHMYRFIWTMLGRAFENNADPGPVVRYPRDEMGSLDSSGSAAKNRDVALMIGRRKRSSSTIALPSEPYVDFQDKPTGIKKWDIDYVKNETNFDQILNFLNFLEDAKLRGLFLQEQGLVQGSGGQSNRNVASEFGDKRDASQVSLMAQVAEVIEDSFLKPAFAINMPEYQGKIKMRTIGFDSDTDEIVRQILQLSGQQQKGSFGVNVNRILEAKGMPMLTPTEYQAEQERIAKAAEQSTTPAVTPTQGRRALVTQTGFDRETEQPIMSYHQLGDEINLSDDGDFVAGLPRTATFSDKQVVSVARSMRSISNGFLSWLYADAARYIGKQRMDFAQPDEEYVNLSVEDTVSKIISGWRPRAEKITEFSAKARAALGRAFDRTTSLHLTRLRAEGRLSSIDKVASQWLDDQGASMVSSVLDTTRQQLVEVLSEGVRSKKTSKEIAQDIREHFDGFSLARASTIARTEVSMSYNYATVRAGMTAGVKRAQLIDGSDDDCKRRNGKIVTLEQALKEKLNHPNAIVAGTFVEPFGNVEVGLSAPWSGPVIELTTADGNRLAVTPNHPVLTQKGWVMAKLLREGDYVLSTPAVNRHGNGADLEDTPPLVEELLDAMGPTSSHTRVVSSPDDLHGDGRLVDGEINVVRANRLLWREGETALIQHGRELVLGEADSELALLARDCSGGSRFEAVGATAASSMRGGSMSGVVLRRPYLDSCLTEPVDDRVRMDAQSIAQLGRALAGRVAVDQIVKVRRLPSWTGNVYDLQTSSSMYGAGGIVVHNCTLYVKLLPLAEDHFEIRHEQLDGFKARYDEANQVVLLSPDLGPEEESRYLLALGETLSGEDLAQDAAIA